MNRFTYVSLSKAHSSSCHLGLLWVILLLECCLITPARSQDVLWGMTSEGGPNEAGTIFSIKSDGRDFTVHHAFKFDSPDGFWPQGSLVEGSDGYFYGMTSSGGFEFRSGTVFKIGADGTDFTVLKKFNPITDGASPYGSLVEGSDGCFYGMTQHGGSGERGTIFKIASNGLNFIVLKSFYWGTDGVEPRGSLIEGRDGNFYGMTSLAGSFSELLYGGGTIFRIAPNGSDFTVLRRFNPSTDGREPWGSLVEGRDGSLYGMTSYGANYSGDYYYYGTGSIFELTLDNIGFKVLKKFNGATDGARPLGSLIEGRDGNLYGMTKEGPGTYGNGTVFKIGADGSGFTTLKKFNGSTDGGIPYSSLVQGNDGNLYGMTASTIFKISPDGTGFTVLKIFNRPTDGVFPKGSLIIQKGSKPPLPTPTKINFQSKWPTPPQGWMKDYGLAFGEHAVADSSLTYGWKRRDNHQAIDLSVVGTFAGNPGNGRHRTSPSDILLATLMHMQGNDVKNFRGTPVESYWEMAVENGEYQVTVSVGDGFVYTAADAESHSINVEGTAAITRFIPQGTQGSMSRFKQATVKVTVSDGYLTLDADGGTNTKINYAIIQPLSSPAVVASKQAISGESSADIHRMQAFPNPFSDKLTLDMNGYQGKITVTLQDVMGNTLLHTQQQVETEAVHLDLASIYLKTGIYLIKITDGNGKSKTIRVVKK